MARKDFEDQGKSMSADYKNWVPESMVRGAAGGSAALMGLAAVCCSKRAIPNDALRTGLTCGLVAAGAAAGGAAIWMNILNKTFDHNGKTKLAKTIVEGVAEYVTIPDGGTGLDVGCGSGALTIACAKRNPNAQMVGCDIWSGAYKAVFTKELCENNARAEGVSNARFEEGNAVRLPFADESFDAVTSNYVYHNVMGKDKQELLLETLRVLKKGGTFAIHDLMSKNRYGDMDAFVRKLKDMGYEDVRLIDTADGTFVEHKKAVWLDLGGSTLLAGRK